MVAHVRLLIKLYLGQYVSSCPRVDLAVFRSTC